MSDDEYDTTCPLCVEEMDLSDQNFLPCPCGYKVCMWCWHHIRENLNGLCPACRTPYNSDPHAFSAVDREDVVKLKKEKKQKEKQEKKVGERVVSAAPGVKPSGSSLMDRKHLHNYRVVQRNLVYVIGVPASYASEENLRRPEFFGQYGKIGKVVIHRNPASAHTTVSVYVTFVHKEDAKASIQSLDGYWMDQQHILRASFGTTKYCNNFIRGVPCNNPECVYLHDLGDDDDRFTKEEIQAGHSKIPPVPGKDQTLVTGNGGPSGTGKRPTGEPVLPPPVFIQDNYPSLSASMSIQASASAISAPPGVGPANPANGAAATAPAGGGIGVGIVTGRPAAASRSGTATWGNPNTLAAITGNAPVDTTAGEKRSQTSTPVLSGGMIPISMIRMGDDEDGSRNHELKIGPPTPRTPAVVAPSVLSAGNGGNVPTAILKRSGSTSSATTLLGPEPSNQAGAPPAAPAAPAAPVPAAAPAIKVKPKTAKEIAAEKKAAAAAAKAAANAPAPAATTPGADATPGEAEAKPAGPAPTPKLTARQQMAQNRADKAAARAAEKAEKAERAAEKAALAAAAAGGANTGTALPPPPALTIAAPISDTASSSASSIGSGAIGGEVSPHTLGSVPAGKVSAIIRRPESKTKLNLLGASPVTTETPEMPALTLPASSSQTILFWNDLPPSAARSSRFNGLGANAVFPVPVSSLSCSVWANILRATNEDLSVNPYGQLTTPMCELLDLTIPPSDALLSATPCWPRPMSYYSSGMSTDGTTFTPAGKHNHQRSVADMAQLPPLPPLPPPSLQPRSDPVFQRGRLSPPPMLTPTGLPGPTTSAGAVGAPALPVPALVPPPRSGKGNGEPAREPREEGSVERVFRNGRAAIAAAKAEAAANAAAAVAASPVTPLSPPPGVAAPAASAAGPAASSPTPAAGTSMNALRQLFPGVKMSVSQGSK